MIKILTIQDKLLLSALALEEAGKERFSAEDLVVMAWKNHPDTFGLQGYADEHGVPIYPNSNRIYAEIMGSKPLRKNGYIRKVGSKMYLLTDLGRSHARALNAETAPTSKTKWSIAREHIEFIRRLLDAKATKKFREQRSADISFFDACGFWGISAGSNAKELWTRFADIEGVLDLALKSIKEGDAVQLRHGGNELALSDLKSLSDLHLYLRERFSGEIEHIKKRTDERRSK